MLVRGIAECPIDPAKVAPEALPQAAEIRDLAKSLVVALDAITITSEVGYSIDILAGYKPENDIYDDIADAWEAYCTNRDHMIDRHAFVKAVAAIFKK